MAKPKQNGVRKSVSIFQKNKRNLVYFEDAMELLTDLYIYTGNFCQRLLPSFGKR